MQEKMDVRVNQTWQQGSVAKLDDFRARRPRNLRPNLAYQVSLDQNFARRSDTPGLHIQHPRGTQHNGVAGTCRNPSRALRSRSAPSPRSENRKRHHRPHGKRQKYSPSFHDSRDGSTHHGKSGRASHARKFLSKVFSVLAMGTRPQNLCRQGTPASLLAQWRQQQPKRERNSSQRHRRSDRAVVPHAGSHQKRNSSPDKSRERSRERERTRPAFGRVLLRQP